MSLETELPRIPETDGMLSVEDAICLRKWAAGHGVRCAAAARAKALEDVKAELERELIKLGGMGMYIQGAGIRLGIDALNKLKDKE